MPTPLCSELRVDETSEADFTLCSRVIKSFIGSTGGVLDESHACFISCALVPTMTDVRPFHVDKDAIQVTGHTAGLDFKKAVTGQPFMSKFYVHSVERKGASDPIVRTVLIPPSLLKRHFDFYPKGVQRYGCMQEAAAKLLGFLSNGPDWEVPSPEPHGLRVLKSLTDKRLEHCLPGTVILTSDGVSHMKAFDGTIRTWPHPTAPSKVVEGPVEWDALEADAVSVASLFTFRGSVRMEECSFFCCDCHKARTIDATTWAIQAWDRTLRFWTDGPCGVARVKDLRSPAMYRMIDAAPFSPVTSQLVHDEEDEERFVPVDSILWTLFVFLRAYAGCQDVTIGNVTVTPGRRCAECALTLASTLLPSLDWQERGEKVLKTFPVPYDSALCSDPCEPLEAYFCINGGVDCAASEAALFDKVRGMSRFVHSGTITLSYHAKKRSGLDGEVVIKNSLLTPLVVDFDGQEVASFAYSLSETKRLIVVQAVDAVDMTGGATMYDHRDTRPTLSSFIAECSDVDSDADSSDEVPRPGPSAGAAASASAMRWASEWRAVTCINDENDRRSHHTGVTSCVCGQGRHRFCPSVARATGRDVEFTADWIAACEAMAVTSYDAFLGMPERVPITPTATVSDSRGLLMAKYQDRVLAMMYKVLYAICSRRSFSWNSRASNFCIEGVRLSAPRKDVCAAILEQLRNNKAESVLHRPASGKPEVITLTLTALALREFEGGSIVCSGVEFVACPPSKDVTDTPAPVWIPITTSPMRRADYVATFCEVCRCHGHHPAHHALEGVQRDGDDMPYHGADLDDATGSGPPTRGPRSS